MPVQSASSTPYLVPGYGVSAVSTIARAPAPRPPRAPAASGRARVAGRPGATTGHHRGPRSASRRWRRPRAGSRRRPCRRPWPARPAGGPRAASPSAPRRSGRRTTRPAGRSAGRPRATPRSTRVRNRTACHCDGGLGGRHALPGPALDVGPDGRRHAATRLVAQGPEPAPTLGWRRLERHLSRPRRPRSSSCPGAGRARTRRSGRWAAARPRGPRPGRC